MKVLLSCCFLASCFCLSRSSRHNLISKKAYENDFTYKPKISISFLYINVNEAGAAKLPKLQIFMCLCRRSREMKKETERRNPRLVLVPCPLQGHINPMLQLGTILESRGFSIAIAHTSYNSPNPESHPKFSFFPIPDGLSDHNISSGDLISLVLNINHNCKTSFHKLIQQEDPHQEKIACIISDELMYFAEAVATTLKLPSIILRTTSAATALARSALLELKAQGLIPYKGNQY